MFLDYGWRRLKARLPVWFAQGRTIARREGYIGLIKRSARKISRFAVYGGDPSRFHRLYYGDWMKNIESRYLNEDYMDKLKNEIGKGPFFSIVFPTWNKDIHLYEKALESVQNQVYDKWELCISDASTENINETRSFLKGYAEKNKGKVKYSYLEDPPKINLIENSVNAVSLAEGEYLVFMDCDDELSQNCLLELAWAIQQNPDLQFIYSDFDKIDMEGNRFDPSFWPDWSPHMILTQMYTTHVTCYRKDIFDEIGGLRKGTVGAQDWDLVLRLSEQIDPKRIAHIPKILYHWRMYPGSTALANSGDKDWAYENQKQVLEDWIERNDEDAEVIPEESQINLRVKFRVKKNPLVSIIIPFRDEVAHLKRCIRSIEERTEYKNYELLLVDNQSSEEETHGFLNEVRNKHRVLSYDHPFHFGKINNWAAEQSKGEHVLFLNNDTEVITGEWLSALLEYSQRDEVGAVGAKLLYPDGRIQHAGVIVGLGGAAAHSHRMFRGNLPGYNGWLVSVRNVLAVTGACMMMKRDLFQDVGGFDKEFDPGYQDVDIGIRLYERGYWNVYTPYAQLYHYESVTRFSDENREKLERDEENAVKLRRKWPKYVDKDFSGDPFYNPNLSSSHEDFRIQTEWYPEDWGKRVGVVR